MDRTRVQVQLGKFNQASMATPLQSYPTFSQGIHPPESKDDTSGLAIRQFPFAPALLIPFSQHIGNPAKPVVRERQEVSRGQVLAKADGFVSVSQHAPASGVVRRIGLMPSITGKMVEGVYLEPHPGSSQEVAEGERCDLDKATPDEIIAATSESFGVSVADLVGTLQT